MRRRARVLLTAAFGILGLAATARADQSPAGQEPIGRGYRFQTYESQRRSETGRLFLLLRVADDNGKIKVCGAYIADMPENRYATVAAEFHDISSSLRLGAPDARGYRLRPGFLAGKRAIVIDGMDGRPRLPLAGFQANCVTTDGAWEARYATEPFTLQLRESQIKPLFAPFR